MGQETRRNKFIHITRIRTQLHIGHIVRKLIYLLFCLSGQHHIIGSGQGGIADIVEFLNLNIREHTNGNGIFHIDAAPDPACHIDIFNHGYIKIQRTDHCTDR